MLNGVLRATISRNVSMPSSTLSPVVTSAANVSCNTIGCTMLTEVCGQLGEHQTVQWLGLEAVQLLSA